LAGRSLIFPIIPDFSIEKSGIKIKDNRLGIPEKHKDKIFSMFKRFHDHVEGSGVGLYIVKRIVDNENSMIKVESKENEGTTLYVYFRR
jgi:light-regulated signal transduction histidine kinase (bacteriophytochrome)